MPDARFTTDHLRLRLHGGTAAVRTTSAAGDALGAVAQVQ